VHNAVEPTRSKTTPLPAHDISRRGTCNIALLVYAECLLRIVRPGSQQSHHACVVVLSRQLGTHSMRLEIGLWLATIPITDVSTFMDLYDSLASSPDDEHAQPRLLDTILHHYY
jgi:hypothetical protein